MNCRDIEKVMLSHSSGAPLAPEAAAHVASCESCLRLVHTLQEAVSPTPPDPDRLARNASGAFTDFTPVKPLPTNGVLRAGLILAMLTVAMVANTILGVAGWRVLTPAQRVEVFGTLATGAAALAFSLMRQIVPGGKVVANSFAFFAAIAGTTAAVFGLIFRPIPEPTFVATGLVCLKIGLTCAVATGVLCWLVLHRGTMFQPVLTGATTGAFAGTAGFIVLEIFCPNLNALHIFAWHFGAALLSAGLGVALGGVAGSFLTRSAP